MGCRGTQALHDKWIPGTLTTRILEGGRGTQALHIGKERGRRGTQALHDEWIPGALTTRIQHAYRGTQALRERNSYVGTLTLRTQILNSRKPEVEWKPGVNRKSPKIKQSRETKRISRKFTIKSFCHRHLPASHNSYNTLLRNQPFVGVHVLDCQLIYKIIRAVLERHVCGGTGW